MTRLPIDAVKDFAVGRLYEDCAFHPVLCTAIEPTQDGDFELSGISLLDGSAPRSCSLRHCGTEPLSVDQVLAIKADFAGYSASRQAEIARVASN